MLLASSVGLFFFLSTLTRNKSKYALLLLLTFSLTNYLMIGLIILGKTATLFVCVCVF